MYTILADDFTGANDTGIQFLSSSENPVVLIDPDIEAVNTYKDLPVLILDTESRHLDQESAYNKIRNSSLLLRNRDLNTFFKKIDSTYRGNVGAEIDGLMDALEYRSAFVISAAPENGRIVKNGCCLVNGKELQDSEFGKDFLSPVHTSFVPDIIRMQSRREVALVTHDIIRKSIQELRIFIKDLLECKNEIIVFDSLDNTDIEKIISASSALSFRTMYAGSSGLGKVFGNNKTNKAIIPFDISERVLFVSGSRKNISSRQIECLLNSGYSAGCVEISVENLIDNRESEIERIVNLVDLFEHRYDHVVIHTSSGISEKLTGSQIKQLSMAVAESIGDITGRVIDKNCFRTLFVTGGDTAVNIMDALNVRSIELLHEIEPGIPLCRETSGKESRDLHFITKAGGFGVDNTLIKILEFVNTHSKKSAHLNLRKAGR